MLDVPQALQKEGRKKGPRALFFLRTDLLQCAVAVLDRVCSAVIKHYGHQQLGEGRVYFR